MTLQLKTKRIIIKPMKNNNKSFAQQQSPKQLQVAHGKRVTSTLWRNSKQAASPGQTSGTDSRNWAPGGIAIDIGISASHPAPNRCYQLHQNRLSKTACDTWGHTTVTSTWSRGLWSSAVDSAVGRTKTVLPNIRNFCCSCCYFLYFVFNISE